jgi:sugar/nucleoside kinase (ribokinase family)
MTSILDKRKDINERASRPLYIWEPVPDLCTKEHYTRLCEALGYVDVCSPNVAELLSFFGEESGAPVDRSKVEDCCNKLITDIPLGGFNDKNAVLVVRAGKDGCYIHPNKWFPAYHQEGQQVVDPTGGGNAFLGGFAITLASHAESSTNSDRIGNASLVDAVCAGNVAASFAIEQVGMPKLGKDSKGNETWNGVVAQDRMEMYKSMLRHLHEVR